MLTRRHALAEYDFRRGRVVPDRLTSGRHGEYLGYAERMLMVYRTGVGRTRRELHQGVQGIFADEADCPQRRIDAFCKLLDDASEYRRDRARDAASLRREVFQLAAARHPLVACGDRLFENDEQTVKAEIAARLGRPWGEIDAGLFADVIDFHRLERFEGYADGRALLARYNVAQVQAALFDAVSMTVRAGRDFKVILRYARLARLMHTIVRESDGYRFRFDGPASVLRGTRRYGTALARFLPALVACRDWRLRAVVRPPRMSTPLSLDLSADDGLTSHLPPPAEFDSSVEETFARRWGPEPRDGWRLVREGEIVHRGQRVFVPDFAFHHNDGRMVLLEIIGFWTPGYLAAKQATLQYFANVPILLAVAESARHALPDLPGDVITYKKVPRVEDVLERLARWGM